MLHYITELPGWKCYQLQLAWQEICCNGVKPYLNYRQSISEVYSTQLIAPKLLTHAQNLSGREEGGSIQDCRQG